MRNELVIVIVSCIRITREVSHDETSLTAPSPIHLSPPPSPLPTLPHTHFPLTPSSFTAIVTARFLCCSVFHSYVCLCIVCDVCFVLV